MLRSLWILAAVSTAVTALCIVTIDQPIARWLATRETYPDVWNQAIAVLEYPLGIEPWKWAGICVLGAASLATLLVARLRSYAAVILIVTLTHLFARNASLWVKTLTGRYRPGQWLAHGGGDTFWHDGGFSFPSGHVLLFGSVLIPIAFVYPRARPLLVVVGFVMIAKLAVNAHFVSDVIGAVAALAAFTWLSARMVRRALPSQILPASLR
jgi:membrane-associated phospholipid phosphatase